MNSIEIIEYSKVKGFDKTKMFGNPFFELVAIQSWLRDEHKIYVEINLDTFGSFASKVGQVNIRGRIQFSNTNKHIKSYEEALCIGIFNSFKFIGRK
jgi:hypothetical protein